MDGIFINNARPATKKALKLAAAEDPASIVIDGTSLFGGFSGYALEAPEDLPFYIVGPDPYTSRKWYATLYNRGGKLVIS